MKILFVSSQALFPETRFGGAKRLYYLAKKLDERCDLSVICLDGCREIGSKADFPFDFSRVLFVPDSEKVRNRDRLKFLPQVHRTLIDSKDSIRAFIGNARYDAVILAFPSALLFAEKGLLPSARKTIYIEDDLLLEGYRSRRRNAATLKEKLFAGLRLRQALNTYRKVMARVSDFACISNQELEIVRSLFPHTSSWLLEYGIPLVDYRVLPETAAHPTLGFIGNFNHVPNRDAALWLARTLFPKVQATYASARLVLCGVNIPQDLREAAAAHGSIMLMENVADLADFYREITVFVNSVREGRGLRTKVLEAAAFGRPVISTPLGAEGLEQFDLPLFSNETGLLDALHQLEHRDARMRSAEKNRAIVESGYSVDAIVHGLIRRIETD